MQEFSLQKVIDYYKLDASTAAKILFPDNMYPMHALNRVLGGKTHLNTDQLTALAKYLGVFIADLFSVESWKGTSLKGTLQFTREDYSAVYNNDGKVILRKGNNTIDIFLIPTGTTILELLTILNQKIDGNN